MKKENKKRLTLREKLLAGILSASFLVTPFANAEEIKLEKYAPKTKLELTIKKEKTIQNEAEIDYSEATTFFDNLFNNLYVDGAELSSDERAEVEKLIKNIKYKNINSYSDLVNTTSDLNENQKLVLLGALANSLYYYNYDITLLEENPVSQDEFFNALQDSLYSNQRIGIGTCGHVSSHIAQLADDLGIRSSEVFVFLEDLGGHAVAIAKKTNGTAIIDGYNSLYTDSKNIKKFLEAYHKDGGAVSFEHLFMEDGEFKYQLVTRDGEQFLKFIDSDGFSSSLKKYLTSNTKSSSPQILARLKLEDYLTSLELNLFSFFAKAGTIRGNSNSALEKAVLLQSGFDRRFLTPNLKNAFLNAFFGNKIIDVNGSFIFGDIQKENGIITPVKGVTGNLFFSTNNEKGLNLGIGISANDAWITGLNSFLVEDILLFDISCRAGLSYTFKGEKIELKPYFIQEFSFFPTHVSIGDYELKPSELTAGGIIALKPLGNDDFKVSLEPYYTGRIWENEFGGNIGIEARGNKIGVNGYFSKSKYDFAPDRFGIGVESELSLKNFYIKLIELGLNVSYGLEGTNYDGETDLKHNLGVSATIKH